MSDRVWYSSLYWRIGVGFVALLAVLLLAQGALFLWLTKGIWGSAYRTPSQLASAAAQDVQTELARNPELRLDAYLAHRYRRPVQPFVIVLHDGRVGTNRGANLLPPGFLEEARRRLARGAAGELEWERSRDMPRPRHAEYASIMDGEVEVGIVAVPRNPPPAFIGLREVAPMLTLAGLALLAAGAAVAALLIFRPAHKRLRELEGATVALREGRSDVRANEAGGDEVGALSRAFNRMADDLQARAAALTASDRARRQLLADVSHELMTPLAAIRGYVETLAMPELSIDEPTRRRYLNIVEEETHKLEAIIGDLLDVARLEGGGERLTMEAVDVRELFERVADRHRPVLCERRLTLDVRIDDSTPLVCGDRARLEQALQNLAANAIRHTPDGGRITLHAAPDAARVRIRVIDTGPGIPPEHLPHIFDRFYKADAARAGTRIPSGSGLGLSIVQAIVNRHGGEVCASNAPGGGAMFELWIPKWEHEFKSAGALAATSRPA
jgi:two-component system, OmpR family, sensor kinase